jgi:ADP-L-glycero-D-manno-heptose 6-epimerase
MILVTGGAGFIGSRLVKALNENGIKDILIVDRLGETSKWKNLRDLSFEDYIHADEFLTNDYEEIHANLKAIFHMGASSSTTVKDMDYLWNNNFNYSKTLFEMARLQDLPFIYASSAATYGDRENHFEDDHKTINQLKALNPYGFSKQVFDQWVLKQKHRPKIWYGLKFFNVYGPGEAHKGEMQSLVRKAFFQIKDTNQVKLFKSHREDYKDGEQLRDFVYVEDLARAMLELYSNGPKNSSGIYNMGTGEARSFKDLVMATFKAKGIEAKIEYIPMPEQLKNQYQYFTQANMQKFISLFPDFKFTSLEKGVEDYVVNYLEKGY